MADPVTPHQFRKVGGGLTVFDGWVLPRFVTVTAYIFVREPLEMLLTTDP